MKYCLHYTNKCSKLTKADEIAIKYTADKGLVDFIKNFENKRIILHINPTNFSNNEVRKLIAIKKQYPQYNFAIALPYFNNTLMSWFLAENIPFFISKPCSSWEEFNYLIKQGVSDINISGALGFELSKVKRVLNSLGRKVQIRAIPNNVENLSSFTDTLIGFYIRPEDVWEYEDYIDVLEFEGLEQQDTFFSIYAEQGYFLGNLNQCIYGLREKIDNNGLMFLFGKGRRNCGRQCLSGGGCRICYTMTDISNPIGARTRNKILEKVEKEQEKLTNGKNLSD